MNWGYAPEYDLEKGVHETIAWYKKRRMALDLFKRVETRKGLFAVEKITLIYNLLTSILILFLFQRMDHPWHMLLDRAMIAVMTFLLMYLYRLAPCKFSAFVKVF